MRTPETLPGRGTGLNPENRYEQIHVEMEPEADEPAPLPTVFYRDTSRSVLAENESPDVGFRFSLNPYRGCEHGCVYCYARPSHEYLSFSAGLDFERRIMVKEDAPELLRQAFLAPRWQPQTVALSGNTDCYQPVERHLQLTRRCLEVFRDFRNPVGVVTKSALVTRDVDLLADLAVHGAAHVLISVTSLDGDLARRMEPRAARPERRLAALQTLSAAGVPTGVMVAPVIPGLNDEESPASCSRRPAPERVVPRGCCWGCLVQSTTCLRPGWRSTSRTAASACWDASVSAAPATSTIVASAAACAAKGCMPSRSPPSSARRRGATGSIVRCHRSMPADSAARRVPASS